MNILGRLFLSLGYRGKLKVIPDELYLRILYRVRTGKKLNLKSPKSFNEKLQWLKLNYRKPIQTQMVDKYEVKDYVKSLIGDEFVIPTIGVWDTFEEIDFESLPDSFVLKCTHDSGGLVICKDKSQLDWNSVGRRIKRSLKKNYYWNSREWPYKNVQPRIMMEPYLVDETANSMGLKQLPVYKFFCFSGNPYMIQTIQNDKLPDESIDYFNCNWEWLNLRQNHPNSKNRMPAPERLAEMVKIAEKLSQGFPFIRVDLYQVNGKVFFSEYTFYSDSGLAAFSPDKWDSELGEMIVLEAGL